MLTLDPHRPQQTTFPTDVMRQSFNIPPRATVNVLEDVEKYPRAITKAQQMIQ